MMTRESSNTEWMTMMPELKLVTSPRWAKAKKMSSIDLEPNWTLPETMMTISLWPKFRRRRRLLVSTACPQTNKETSWKVLCNIEIRWLLRETPKESQMIPPELPLDTTDKMQPAETISIWREWLRTKPILLLEAKVNTWTKTWATTRLVIWRTCPTKRNTCTCKRWTPWRTTKWTVWTAWTVWTVTTEMVWATCKVKEAWAKTPWAQWCRRVMEVPEALVAMVAQEACPAAMEEDHQANKQANKDQEETSKAKPWDYSTE